MELRRWIAVLALTGAVALLVVGPGQAFFPAAPPTPSQGGSNGGGGNTGNVPPPPDDSMPPPSPILPGTTGGTTPPGGGGAPEIDSGALVSAMGLLLCGALVVTDRFRRTQSRPPQA
jgi:hypothetical protein